MMKRDEIVAGLRRQRVETGSIACLGCGWENSCGVHGCRIMREAADMLENDETCDGVLRDAIEKWKKAYGTLREKHSALLEQNGKLRDAAASASRLKGILVGTAPERTVTVADAIRRMSDEELATEIIRRWRSEMEDVFREDISKRWCDMQGGCVSSKGYHRPCTDNRLFACVLRWLGKPAEEEGLWSGWGTSP